MVKDLVSVIVPTQNRENMLIRAIESIQNQTYKSIEIIIIANGCIDNTNEVVSNLQKNYKNIKFLNFEESLGGAEARNKGLDVVEGEFIAFLDDDDEWLEDKLEQQISLLKENQYCIVGCSYKEITLSNSIKLRRLKEEVLFDDMCFENLLGSYSFCVTKREYLQDLKINKKFKANQDWDLWLKIFLKTQKKAYVIQDYLVKYYQHDNKISKNYKNKIDAQKLFLLYWKNNLNKKAIHYQEIRIIFSSFLEDRKIKKYLFKLPFILKTIYNSPYRFDWKKYYIYINFLRYLK